GGRDMAVEHARVRVVEDRGLDATAEKRLRLAHEVLVEGVLGGDEHGEAVASAPGTAPLLAQARDRARKPDRDRAVEQADVDAELERVRGRNAEQVAVDEAPFELAPLLRRVAGAVRREALRLVGVHPLRGHAVDELGRLAAPREAERPALPPHDRGEQARRLAERARTDAELGVEER